MAAIEIEAGMFAKCQGEEKQQEFRIEERASLEGPETGLLQHIELAPTAARKTLIESANRPRSAAFRPLTGPPGQCL